MNFFTNGVKDVCVCVCSSNENNGCGDVATVRNVMMSTAQDR